MLLFLLLVQSLAGKIYPKTSRPIVLSRNNQYSSADYTFFYQISSYIPSTAILEITFPQTTYPSGLGLASCKATNWNTIQLSCKITNTIVSINVGELSNANSNNTYNLTIHNIPNPFIGGSSMFKLQIRTGINILDYCDFFSDVGIVAALNPISIASVVCNSNCITGAVSTYAVSYTNTVSYPIKSRIFIQFPDTLTFPNPVVCASVQISGISCTQQNNLVSVSLLTNAIQSGTSLTITFSSVINPIVSGNIGSFNIHALGPVVNTVLEEVIGVAGPSIVPNVITTVIACPGGSPAYCIGYYPYVSLKNTQPYYLTITTTNPVPLGGAFFITFVPGFVLRANYCLITNGLKNQGYTEDDQILCTVNPTARTLTITKFNNFYGGVFSLTVIATNPSVSGTYASFSVSTYADVARTELIDTGSSGFITVVNLPPPKSWNVTWNYPLVVSTIVQQTVIFQPFTSGLDSSMVSFKVNFPSSFSFTGTVKGYLTPHDLFPEITVTPAFTGNFVQIPSATVAQPYTNDLVNENRFRIAGGTLSDGILLPAMPGHYFIEMVIVSNGVDIEATLYEMIVLPGTMSGSIFAYSYDVLKNSLYELQFTPTITIPQGTVPDLPQNTWGTFDIWFPTMNTNLQPLWLPDLGTNKTYLEIIPCKGIQNIFPVNGDNLLCRLIPASSVSPNSYATVRVTNFEIIYLNVPVTIHLANLQNLETPNIDAAVTVATYQITQRVYQELNQVNFTYPLQFYLNKNPNLPTINGRSPAPNGDGLNFISFLPNTVNLVSQVSFILWMENNLQIGSSFYLIFPTAYPLLETGISCYINYANTMPCYTYPDAGWISILNLPISMKNHVEYTFTIRYLKNPSHKEQPASAWAVAITSKFEIEYIYFSPFAYLDLGAVSPVNVYPSSYKALAVDVSYYWIFILTNNIPQGGCIILTFPKKDYVLTINPLPKCVISGALYALNSLSSINCTISGTSIILTNFASYKGKNQISVTITGILNPPTSRKTDYFQIETYDDSNKLVDANYIIPKITIQAALAVGVFTYIDFHANPNNGYATADYTISILPSLTIPAQSLITVIFPQNEFPNLSVSQTCKLFGGLTTLESCYGNSANTVTIVTDSDYIQSSLSTPINITIYNIQNFAPLLTSGLLEVEIYNSGVLIDSSPDTSNNRKVTMGHQAGLITLIDLVYYPITAGERAVYNFTFQPSTSFTADCSIAIIFPDGFSRDLSEILYCYSSEIGKVIGKSVQCSTNGVVLTVFDTLGWNATGPSNFTISMQHIRNPNTLISANFIFYTQCGYEMQDYGQFSFSASFAQTPAVMYLNYEYSYGDTTSFAQESIILEAFSPNLFVANQNDLIFVDFPIDYNLMFVSSQISCKAGLNADTILANCSYEPNRVKISAFSFNTDTNSVYNYSAFLNNIENPAVEQPARYISLSLYQASASAVYSKTYSNLNLVNAFSYISQGIQVIVNSLQQFTINVGTSIDSISVNIPSGAQTAFSIYGYISEPDCVISPNPINFSIRSFYSYFSVSCNSNAVIGKYYITWNFEGTWPPNYWSPIQRTYFTIVETNSDTISVGDIGIVNLGGQTMPISITLSHSPESFVTVNLFKVGTLPSNITIFPKSVNFTRGVTSGTFTVTVDRSSIGVSGKILLTKSGTNAQYFTLQRSLIAYDVGPVDTSYPTIVQYSTLAINRISASFGLTIDKPCIVYWMIGRYGTRPPTTQEVMSKVLTNVNELHDSPIFGADFNYNQLLSNRFSYTISIQGLLAQTNYTVYFFAKDIGGNFASFIPKLTFSTLPRYKIATFPLYCTEVLTDQQVASALATIAGILGINSSFVLNRTDYSGGTGSPPPTIPYETNNYISSSGLSRLLSTIFHIDVLIIPDISQDLRPLDLANSLNNYKTALSAIPGFNSSYTIVGQEIYGIIPVFKSKPKIGSVLAGTLTMIDLSLFNSGIISICLIVYNSSNYISPIPYQVNNQLDPRNYPCNMTEVLSAGPVPTQSFISSIFPNLYYRVLICAYNTLQYYPDYMNEVEVISFSTFGMSLTKSTSFASRFLVSISILILI